MTNDQIAKSMAYKNTFSSEHGKKVMDDLDSFGFFRKPDKCCVIDSVNETYFNLGKLSIVRYIHDEINKNLTEEKDNKAVHKEI